MISFTAIIGIFAIAIVAANSQLVSQGEFNNAATWNGYPVPSWQQYDAFVRQIESRANIRTKQEAAMALTHYLHESDGLRAKREYACENTGCPEQYKTPGCDREGQRYFGRGYIQLTWCYNYRDASMELYGNDWLIGDADAVARDEYIAWQTAFWFWKARVQTKPGVSEGQFGASTRAINGGYECDGDRKHVARKRFEMYGRVRSAFGLPGPGDERGCYN